jgi:hypothetical protein
VHLQIGFDFFFNTPLERCNLFPGMATSQSGGGFLLLSYWSKLQIRRNSPIYHIAFLCVTWTTFVAGFFILERKA